MEEGGLKDCLAEEIRVVFAEKYRSQMGKVVVHDTAIADRTMYVNPLKAIFMLYLYLSISESREAKRLSKKLNESGVYKEVIKTLESYRKNISAGNVIWTMYLSYEFFTSNFFPDAKLNYEEFLERERNGGVSESIHEIIHHIDQKINNLRTAIPIGHLVDVRDERIIFLASKNDRETKFNLANTFYFGEKFLKSKLFYVVGVEIPAYVGAVEFLSEKTKIDRKKLVGYHFYIDVLNFSILPMIKQKERPEIIASMISFYLWHAFTSGLLLKHEEMVERSFTDYLKKPVQERIPLEVRENPQPILDLIKAGVENYSALALRSVAYATLI